MNQPIPERDPSEVMDRFEFAALLEVLETPFSIDDFWEVNDYGGWGE